MNFTTLEGHHGRSREQHHEGFTGALGVLALAAEQGRDATAYDGSGCVVAYTREDRTITIAGPETKGTPGRSYR